MNYEYESLEILKNINNNLIDLKQLIKIIDKRLIKINRDLNE